MTSWAALCCVPRGSIRFARYRHGCAICMLCREDCCLPCRWSFGCGGSPPRGDTTLTQAVAAARTEWDARKAAGMDQGALENAARSGLALGEFEDSEEDGVAVVEEFYPVEGARPDNNITEFLPQSNLRLADQLKK